MGDAKVGDAKMGDAKVGDAKVGDAKVGDSVLGAAVLGAAPARGHAASHPEQRRRRRSIPAGVEIAFLRRGVP